MNDNLSTGQIETTGRYIVLLPKEAGTAGISAITNAIGAEEINDSAMSNIGVAVVTLDPNQLQSLNIAIAGPQPILAVEPEQIMYAIGNIAINGDMANYLQGYKDGTSNLVDSLTNGGSQSRQELTTSNFSDIAGATWGLQATKALGNLYTGSGIKVAVLDTGIDLTHPDFVGRAITSQSFITGESVQDLQGHGTHCIGTSCGLLNPPDSATPRRYGVAYNAQIFAGKVLSNLGSGADGGILAGIDWAITNGCEIISMSLGADVPFGTPYSRIYEEVAKRALSKGTLIIAAAGNASTPNSIRPVGRPANCPSIMAVAAVDKQFTIASFSSRSELNFGGVDIAGPGVDVYSTWSTQSVSSLRYRTISGTSMATPHVAGLAALYAEATGKRGLELWALLLQNAQRLPLSSMDAGIGLVQAPPF